MAMVIDTSVTMAWCFENEATSATDAVLDALLDTSAVVPPLWHLEVTNVLLVAERRGRVTEAQASRFVELLQQLPIAVDTVGATASELLRIGRHHGLTAYDAAYLSLAERLGVSLATLDADLAAAARSAGVSVLAAPS